MFLCEKSYWKINKSRRKKGVCGGPVAGQRLLSQHCHLQVPSAPCARGGDVGSDWLAVPESTNLLAASGHPRDCSWLGSGSVHYSCLCFCSLLQRTVQLRISLLWSSREGPCPKHPPRARAHTLSSGCTVTINEHSCNTVPYRLLLPSRVS